MLQNPKLEGYLQKRFFTSALQRAKKERFQNLQARALMGLANFKKSYEEKALFLKRASELAGADNQLQKELKERIFKHSPRLNQNPDLGPESWFPIARDFERVRNFKKSRLYYSKIIKKESISYEIKKKSYYRLALTYKLERNRTKYAKAISQMTSWLESLLLKEGKGPNGQIYIKDFFKYQTLLARAYWTLQKSRKSMSLLKKLSAQAPKGNILANILWLKGSIFLEWKKYDQAIIKFQKAFIQADRDDLFQKISWSLSWTFFTKKEYKRAIHYFEKSLEQIKDKNDQLKLRYWLAKSYLKIKDKMKSQEIFNKLSSDSPYSYYGILSKKELNQKILPPLIQPLEKYKDLKLQWLIALEEYELAKDYLKSVIPQKDHSTLLLYLPYFIELKDYANGMMAYFSIPSEKRFELKDKYHQLIYPTPFLNEIQMASKKYSLSKSFIYSIMRQESAFDPQARSWADAFGLLQLLPERAKQLSLKSNFKFKHYTDLFDPEINIKLGSQLLKDLQQEKKNKFVIYVSSYNAGERAVSRWVKSRFKGDYLEFIENIPYNETKKYVKLVLRNYINYRRGLNQESFYFPKKFFTTKLTH